MSPAPPGTAGPVDEWKAQSWERRGPPRGRSRKRSSWLPQEFDRLTTQAYVTTAGRKHRGSLRNRGLELSTQPRGGVWVPATPGNADKYEALLRREIFIGIRDRHIPGFSSIQLLRRAVGSEVEFVTLMMFESLEAVRGFAGADYEIAVVPEKARELLAHFDVRSQRYELRAESLPAGDVPILFNCGGPTHT